MTTFVRALALACLAVALSAGAANAGQASSLVSTPVYSTNPLMVGGLTYHGSFRLKPGGVYDFSYSLKGRTLGNPKSGKYRLSGSKITFTSGFLSSFYGVQKDAKKFTMHIKETRELFTWCYLK